MLPGPTPSNQPALELTLRRDSIELPPVFGIIDTAAEFSLFSGQLASALGLTLQDGRLCSLDSLGGPVTAYAHEIEIVIEHGWSLGLVEVLFSDRDIPRNLIGRSDILFRLVLGISERREEIYLLDADAY